ncbi:alpha/beta hydrolase [Nitrosospira sp. Is2]|uniref:alpha/beta hydrolase n=1 Tax=Nitrosospira sp. Is2 TaxID=3080532 RepID=UPI0029555BD5|nr:alpha/beta hydrolase [Nitrosospira sp. Is2]WON74757.1 alpha/beta hydrolase [Nitrosospira sp. Is2]
MPLDPDLAAFLELVDAGIGNGARPLHEMPVSDARLQYDASTLALDSEGMEVASVSSICIRSRDGKEIDARLYVPAVPSPGRLLPALLYFHGGGYCVGSLDSHDSLCRTLAALTPCCVLSVAYRLAPEHPFPTAVHDAQDAYQWLLANGPASGIDTQNIAVGGDSAGGTLATVITITLRDSGGPQPKLQVLLYPCTSASQDTESHRRLAGGYLLEAPTLQWMFSNYLANEADRKDWRFAPLETPDLTGVAPAFIALAEYDPLVDEGMKYADKLKAAGVTTQLRVYPGMTHDFARLGNIVAEGAQVRRDIASMLASAFQSS